MAAMKVWWKLMQQSLSEWEVINEQIQRSKISRINWKHIFNESLTQVVARYYAKGHDATETYDLIKKRLSNMQITNQELLRKLKIGVCARFGEMNTQGKIIR